MQRYLRGTAQTVAIAFAVLAGVGIAAAQMSPSSNTMSPSGSTTTKQNRSLQLTAAQKSAIYRAVSAEKPKAQASANFHAAIGQPVPAAVELHALPDAAVAEAPAARPYMFTFARNEVLLVDPTTKNIVEIIKQ